MFGKEKTVIRGTLDDKAKGDLCSYEDSCMEIGSDMCGYGNIVPEAAKAASSSSVSISGVSGGLGLADMFVVSSWMANADSGFNTLSTLSANHSVTPSDVFLHGNRLMVEEDSCFVFLSLGVQPCLKVMLPAGAEIYDKLITGIQEQVEILTMHEADPRLTGFLEAVVKERSETNVWVRLYSLYRKKKAPDKNNKDVAFGLAANTMLGVDPRLEGFLEEVVGIIKRRSEMKLEVKSFKICKEGVPDLDFAGESISINVDAEIGFITIGRPGGAYTYVLDTLRPSIGLIRLWVGCLIMPPCIVTLVAKYAVELMFPECYPPDGMKCLLEFINCREVKLAQDIFTYAMVMVTGIIQGNVEDFKMEDTGATAITYILVTVVEVLTNVTFYRTLSVLTYSSPSLFYSGGMQGKTPDILSMIQIFEKPAPTMVIDLPMVSLVWISSFNMYDLMNSIEFVCLLWLRVTKPD